MTTLFFYVQKFLCDIFFYTNQNNVEEKEIFSKVLGLVAKHLEIKIATVKKLGKNKYFLVSFSIIIQ